MGKPPTFRVAERIRFDGHVEEGVRLAHGILNRLRFSRDDMEQVEALIANHMRFKDAHRMKESTLKRFLRMPDFGEHLELHRLDCLASNRKLENYELVKRKLGELPEEQLKPAAAGDRRGPDRRGIRAGAAVSRMLAAVEDAQLEGRIGSREEAMEMVPGCRGAEFPGGYRETREVIAMITRSSA